MDSRTLEPLQRLAKFLSFVLAVCVPLAMWKIAELIYWIVTHVSFS